MNSGYKNDFDEYWHEMVLPVVDMFESARNWKKADLEFAMFNLECYDIYWYIGWLNKFTEGEKIQVKNLTDKTSPNIYKYFEMRINRATLVKKFCKEYELK